jgi:uncharacterized membrane protein
MITKSQLNWLKKRDSIQFSYYTILITNFVSHLCIFSIVSILLTKGIKVYLNVSILYFKLKLIPISRTIEKVLRLEKTE